MIGQWWVDDGWAICQPFFFRYSGMLGDVSMKIDDALVIGRWCIDVFFQNSRDASEMCQWKSMKCWWVSDTSTFFFSEIQGCVDDAFLMIIQFRIIFKNLLEFNKIHRNTWSLTFFAQTFILLFIYLLLLLIFNIVCWCRKIIHRWNISNKYE